jgi:hypothetical protein
MIEIPVRCVGTDGNEYSAEVSLISKPLISLVHDAHKLCFI